MNCCNVCMQMKQAAVKSVTVLISLMIVVVSGHHGPYGSYCPTVQETDVRLLLYTQKSIHRPITINKAAPVGIDPNKKIVFIIHGWLSSPSSFGFPDLKDAYLKRYDCNVIMVDWSVPAYQVYEKAYCSIPQIGQILSNFLCLLQARLKISVNTVHMVGHSFGAQISAFTGQDTVVKCTQQVGRITAMDPARPHYQGISTSLRLDKDDAVFVDVIHSNDGEFGYFGDCGDVDFYLNCGSLQPGCLTTPLGDWIDHPIAAVSCDHFRSVEFMAESVNSDKFKGKFCSRCHFVCSPDETNTDEIIMGEDCPTNASGSYVVYTNSKPPYAMG